MKNKRAVRASEIGQVVYCPKALELKLKGVKPNYQARKNIQRGNREHEAFNQRVTQDKRCYIATYLYGPDAPQTQLLRDWRDGVLAKTVLGRVAIKCYYAISPSLVTCSKYLPLLGRSFQVITDSVVAKIKERNNV